ncbi:TPA: hypothetical protein ACH3X3_015181 [Trebouxia sp. C0006]
MPGYAAAHLKPDGPGDARPTATAIVADENLVGELSNKVILITGCSSGLGIETARALHATGAHLFITARDVKKGQEVVNDIVTSNSGVTAKVDVLKLDLGSLQSVRNCASNFLSKSKQLNILINNAGVMAAPEDKTEDGFETQFGVNHMGHFLLFQLLKPALIASSSPEFNSRVVSLSSSNHRFSGVHLDDLDLKKAGYDPWVSYGQSKTANIYFANEVDRRFGSHGLHATSVHPGGIMTNLPRHVDPQILKSMVTPAMLLAMKSPEQGQQQLSGLQWGSNGRGRGVNFWRTGSVSEPFVVDDPRHEGWGPMAPGYVPHVYDQQASQQLWDVSLKLVGLQE